MLKNLFSKDLSEKELNQARTALFPEKGFKDGKYINLQQKMRQLFVDQGASWEKSSVWFNLKITMIFQLKFINPVMWVPGNFSGINTSTN